MDIPDAVVDFFQAKVLAFKEMRKSTMAELCRRYEISRPTGYKWVDRFEAAGTRFRSIVDVSLHGIGDYLLATHARRGADP